jgi:polyhydroxybutyrate depolymerase
VLVVATAVVALAAPAAWLASSASPDSVRVVASAEGHSERIVSFTNGGARRHYRLYVPRRQLQGRHPLLVVLHQLGGNAAGFERQTQLDRRAAAIGAVVVYPDGLGHSWNAGTCCGYAVRHHVDDVRYILRVVADVERRLPIDPGRVAVTGFSNGALMSYRLACERPDVFRVAVAVAGDIVGARCNPASPVAVLHVHGGRDATIPLTGNAFSRLDPAGFPPAAASIERVAVADGCTGATTAASDTLVDWKASGCAGGTPVELITIPEMGHHYPVGAQDKATYGVDMSALTWSFVTAAWAAG